MVFQNYALYPHMTVYDNMAFGLKLRKLPKEEIDRRVREAADILGLEDLLQRKPKALSGGQRQRVAIARALVNNPSILLADEPTGNLDYKTGVEIMNLFERLYAAGNTTILVAHEPDVAAHAKRVISIRDGQIEKDVRQAA
jgi:ABC-type sugar transport system ATPase subunit